MQLATILALAASVVPRVLAHSWIEQMVNVNDKGLYVGEFGYARGFVDKTAPNFNQQSDLWLLPEITRQPPFINSGDLLCRPSQRNQTQSANYPRLQATPGGFMALRYAENGHVSQPDQLPGKPAKGGTTFVFGTTQPKDDETVANVMQWTADGSGGDKRGLLLAANDFDDGRCHEISSFPISKQRQQQFPNFAQGQSASAGAQGSFPFLCETNVALPKTAATGQPYTLYWLWQWPTEPGANVAGGKDEYYSTCMDVDVGHSVAQSFKPSITLLQQDGNTAAVSNFASRSAATANPTKGELGSVFGSAAPSAASSPASTTAASSAATTSPALGSSAASSVRPSASSSPAKASTVPGNTVNSVSIPAITNRPTHSARNTAQVDGQTVSSGAEAAVSTMVVTQKVTVTAPATLEKRVTSISACPSSPASQQTTKVAREQMSLSQRGSAKFRGRI